MLHRFRDSKNLLDPSAVKCKTPPLAEPTRATTTLALLEGKVPAGNKPSDTSPVKSIGIR